MHTAALTSYSLLKTLHIVSAIAAFGGVFFAPVYLQVVKRQSGFETKTVLHKLRLTVERSLVVPAMVITFFAGVMLTMDQWSFSSAWISVGFLAIVVLFGISGAIVIPAERQAANLAQEQQQSAYISVIRKLEVTAWIQIAIVCCTVLVMVVKPGM